LDSNEAVRLTRQEDWDRAGLACLGVTLVPDAGAQIGRSIPFNTSTPNASFIIQNMTAGNPYSYMNGYSEGDGGSGPLAEAVCFP
jgi:hypothetical protein